MFFKANLPRKLRLIPMLAFSALIGCAGSAPSVDTGRIDVRPPESDVTAPCALATRINGAALTDPAAQEVAWQADRKNLALCRGRHAEAVAWINGTLEALNR